MAARERSTGRTAARSGRPPRSASDAWRLNLAALVSVPAGLGLAVALRTWRPDLGQLEFSFVGMSIIWALYAVVYLAWTWLAFRPYSGAGLRRVVRLTTPVTTRARLMLWLSGMDGVSLPLMGAVAGFAGVVALLLMPALRSDWLVVAAAFLLVAGSWVLLIAAFAVTYLRVWASEGGLRIPGEGPERFADFVYASVQVATTFASSDVETRTTRARNWVSLNSIIAFVFNTVVIALFLSVATAAAG